MTVRTAHPSLCEQLALAMLNVERPYYHGLPDTETWREYLGRADAYLAAFGDALVPFEHAAGKHHAEMLDCGELSCPLNWRRPA